MRGYRTLRDMDWMLILLSLVICALGILQIYSAGQESKFVNVWWRQILFVAAGLGLMWLICQVDYRTLLGQVPIFYAVSVVLLVGVLALGAQLFGSRRWIRLPFGFVLQVSEFAKVVIVLLVARYLTSLKREYLEGKDILKLGGLVAVPLVLIAAQPDLGTALTYLPVFGIGIMLSGLQLRHAVLIAVLGLATPFISYQFLLKDYQKARLASFLEPDLDRQGKGYQVTQSRIAIGSGKMWGLGVTQGKQTRLRFLPVAHADFIFATWGEEQGFVGVAIVLGLYLLLLLQIVQNAQTAPDRAGMYICMGVAALLLFHVTVNVGMVAGFMPVTGIPLPLMSAGGSSTLTIFLLLGLVNNVRLRRFVS